MARRHNSVVADDAHLATLGHKQELTRHFSPLSMLGLAFAILNSWTALSASLSLALPSGGSTSVLWGLVTAGICNLCLAASLAEFLSAYPTAGGQYHWVAVVSWPEWIPILSWTCGWINCFGWIALTATAGLLGSQLIIGIIPMYNAAYEPQRWHQFLIYIGYNLVAFLVNAFGNKVIPLVNKTAIIWSISGFVIISITVLACASPDYSSAKFVFTGFLNETGWPDGVAWLLGLLQGALGLTGFDACAHMIEEIPNPAVEGISILTTSSRMNYAFARDKGLPFSRYFSRVHGSLNIPLNSLCATSLIVVIFGCIFLGSTSAFNAIVSASVVALGITYAMPVAINCLRGRRMLPATRHFKLPEPFAWFANLLGIAFVIVTTVLFVFPPDLPVTGSSMNYCIVAFLIVLIISMIQWFVDGRKNYTGPKLDLNDTVLTAAHTREDAIFGGPEMASQEGSDKKYGEDA
nr:hypothetical protein B0A51_05139 [Rachicladosporium sp. CCFEE 5018]